MPVNQEEIPLNIRNASMDDAESIAAIYNPFVLNTSISFEEAPVSHTEMAQRITDIHAAGLPWLVAEQDGVIAGYAYASKWRARHAYRFSVESSVYLAPANVGKGLGTALIERCLNGCVATVITWRSAASPCRTRRASRCMKSSVLNRWRSSGKLDSSSATGAMSLTGS